MWCYLPAPASLAPCSMRKLCQNPIPSSRKIQPGGIRRAWGKPQQETCRELSWQSQEHQRGCCPSLCPLGKSFLPYQTSSPGLEHPCREEYPSCKSAPSFCSLLEQNHPSSSSGLEKGGSVCNCWADEGKEDVFKLPENSCTL